MSYEQIEHDAREALARADFTIGWCRGIDKQREERERRAAAEAAAAARRAALQPFVNEADAAAAEWLRVNPDCREDSRAAGWRRHIVELAHQEPVIRLCWLKPWQRSTSLVGRNALAYAAELAIVCRPVLTRSGYVTALHELGHCRDRRPGSQVARETQAWSWAMHAADCWDETSHAVLRRCLGSYVEAATVRDVIDILDAEKLMSDKALRFQQARREILAITKEHK